MDTLGFDRKISENQKIEVRKFVNILKQSWEQTEKKQLEADIDKQLKLLHHPGEQGVETEIPNYL